MQLINTINLEGFKYYTCLLVLKKDYCEWGNGVIRESIPFECEQLTEKNIINYQNLNLPKIKLKPSTKFTASKENCKLRQEGVYYDECIDYYYILGTNDLKSLYVVETIRKE